MSKDPVINGSHELLEKKIGENLKSYRLDKNLNQGDLAELAGLSRRTITSVDNGQGCTLSTLIRITRALGEEQILSRLLEPPPISPTKLHEANLILQKKRKHASKPRQKTDPEPWTWNTPDPS